ncbi:MAG: dimethyl sulfoxide reductase anchor subunit [Chloroflexota bacterium]|nr:dimethyl sulfoxide reductase anchor subunit [Chloroflexota bacterium]
MDWTVRAPGSQRRARLLVVGDEFVMGYRQQGQWNWLIATAFVLGKVGSGLFVVSFLTQFPAGMLLGWLVGTFGKGAAHLAYLGKPLRFWRAVMHPRTSWLARGLWAMGAFGLFGLLTGLNAAGAPPGQRLSGPWLAAAAIALLAALFMMVYDGFVLAASPSMALWNTPLMPLIAFFYALLGGITFTVVLAVGLDAQLVWAWSGAGIGVGPLESAEVGLVVLNFLIVVSWLSVMFGSTERTKRAVEVLLSMYRVPFFSGVVLVGFMGTALLAFLFALVENVQLLIGVALADVIGHYLLFYLILKAGLFAPPIMRRAVHRGRDRR